jgi:transposase InsO family protein
LIAATVIIARREIFACHSTPERFISERGPQYVNQDFLSFASQYGFDHQTSSFRHPQGNGLAQRKVQTLKSAEEIFLFR